MSVHFPESVMPESEYFQSGIEIAGTKSTGVK